MDYMLEKEYVRMAKTVFQWFHKYVYNEYVGATEATVHPIFMY